MPLNEQLFHTLLPNTLLTLLTPFIRSRPSTGDKPLAKDDPDYMCHRNAERGACGVDGLEAGQDCVLTLARDPKIHVFLESPSQKGPRFSALLLSPAPQSCLISCRIHHYQYF